MAGYNFNEISEGIPVSVGFGYLKYSLEYASLSAFNSVQSEDYYNSFSFGIGYHSIISLSVGVTYKTFNSELPSMDIDNTIYSLEDNAIDFGALAVIPISDLFFGQAKINLSENSSISPKTNLSLGYAYANIGDEVYYVDPAQSDPIPRSVRFGYDLNLGFDILVNETELNLFDYSFTIEAFDILASIGTSGVEYDGPFGKINIIDNLFLLEGNDDVAVHKGRSFNILETVTLQLGRVAGQNYYPMRNNGVIISMNGLLKLLNETIDNKIIRLLAKHIEINYYDAEKEVPFPIGLDNASELSAISVSLKNFNLF